MTYYIDVDVQSHSLHTTCIQETDTSWNSYFARGHWFYHPYHYRFVAQNSQNYTNVYINTSHICTYLNIFLMMIHNIVTKFQNVDVFGHFVTFLTCRLLMTAAWKVFIYKCVNENKYIIMYTSPQILFGTGGGNCCRVSKAISSMNHLKDLGHFSLRNLSWSDISPYKGCPLSWGLSA